MVIELTGLRYERPGSGSNDPGFAMQVDSLHLDAGEAIGIVGPSGCGKSTLVDLLAMLRRPTQISRFVLLGRDVAALWHEGGVEACLKLRAAHIGVVLQTGGLLPSLSVRENVLLSQRLLGRMDISWVDHLLDALGLADLQSRLPAQLSIGQRQRVAIARALAHRPALVLADEPTAALGAEHATQALDLLLSLSHDVGSALVIVSHDTRLLHAKAIPMRQCIVREATVCLEAA